VLVLTPNELIARKVESMIGRPQTAKGLMDVADLRRLLLTFPELKSERGAVRDRLEAAGATPEVLGAWAELVTREILPDDEDAEFGGP
jgi:hypothetical protein